MKQSLFAIFKSQDQAKQALDALLDADFSRIDARLTSSSDSTQTEPGISTSHQAKEDESLGHKIGKMFGIGSEEDNQSSLQASGTTGGQGHNALSVDVDSEAERERAEDIINRFDAGNIEIRRRNSSGSQSSEPSEAGNPLDGNGGGFRHSSRGTEEAIDPPRRYSRGEVVSDGDGGETCTAKDDVRRTDAEVEHGA